MNASWLEFVRTAWPIVTTVASLLSLAMIVWLKAHFASRAELKVATDDITVHETRIKVLEEHSAQSPTRQELQDDISQLAERMRGVEIGQDGIQRQLQTANNYLHTLVEKGLNR